MKNSQSLLNKTQASNKEPRLWHIRLKKTGYLLCGKGPFTPKSKAGQAEARTFPECEECHFKWNSRRRSK